MTKKEYINPEMEVVKVQTMQMLATSGNVDIDPNPTDPSDSAAPGLNLYW